jgi:hypothetical protein
MKKLLFLLSIISLTNAFGGEEVSFVISQGKRLAGISPSAGPTDISSGKRSAFKDLRKVRTASYIVAVERKEAEEVDLESNLKSPENKLRSSSYNKAIKPSLIQSKSSNDERESVWFLEELAKEKETLESLEAVSNKAFEEIICKILESRELFDNKIAAEDGEEE